jgi:hypothetical protein
LFSRTWLISALPKGSESHPQISEKNPVWKKFDPETQHQIQAATMGIMEAMAKTAEIISSGGGATDMRPIWEIVANLESSGLRPSPMAVSHVLNIGVMLSAAGNATAADGARIMQWARAHGIVADTILCSLQMDLLAKAASHGNAGSEDGFALLREMAAQGTEANVVTYTSLLDLIAHAIASGRGDLPDIARAQAAMHAAGVAPNNQARTATLHAYSAAAKRGHAVVADARAALDAAYAAAPAEGPDCATALHNALLDVLAKSAAYGRATYPDSLAAVDAMRARRVPRDAATYHALLEAGKHAAGRGAVALADGWAVLGVMDTDGVAPTEPCFVSLLAWHAKAAAAQAAAEDRDRARAPEEGSVPALEAARGVRAEMVRRGLEPGPAVYAAELEVRDRPPPAILTFMYTYIRYIHTYIHTYIRINLAHMCVFCMYIGKCYHMYTAVHAAEPTRPYNNYIYHIMVIYSVLYTI